MESVKSSKNQLILHQNLTVWLSVTFNHIINDDRNPKAKSSLESLQYNDSTHSNTQVLTTCLISRKMLGEGFWEEMFIRKVQILPSRPEV